MKCRKNMFLVYLITTLSVSTQAQVRNIDHDEEKKIVWGNTLTLEQNYPNPFSPNEETTIDYHVAHVDEAAIIIYDAQTKKPVHEFRNLKHGGGQVVVNGQQLSKGNYIYALIVNGRMVAKRKMKVA